jgi:hypothetical protein
MLKWIAVLLIAVGVYFAWENWPSLRTQWSQTVARLPAGSQTGTMAIAQTDGSVVNITVPLATESWSQRDVGGLRMNLPFELQAVTIPTTGQIPKGVQIDSFAGKSRTHEVVLAHMTMSIVGAMPLWIFNGPMQHTSNKLGLQVLTKNPPTLLNSFRAQRTDCVTKNNPRLRYRFLLIERGSQAWLIETHAAETDAGFEPSFQKMIYSVQPL